MNGYHVVSGYQRKMVFISFPTKMQSHGYIGLMENGFSIRQIQQEKKPELFMHGCLCQKNTRTVMQNEQKRHLQDIH